ncbi:hypothetical protein VYU27_005915 [Nannochloropsis oceanica]
MLPATADGYTYQEQDNDDKSSSSRPSLTPSNISSLMVGPELDPQHCFLSEGSATLLPEPLGEEEAAHHAQFVGTCKEEDARLGAYLHRLVTALAPVLELLHAYSSLLREELGLDPEEYLQKSVVRKWMSVLEGQQGRMQLLDSLCSALMAAAAAGGGMDGDKTSSLSFLPSSLEGWAAVEEGPEEAMEKVWPSWQRSGADAKGSGERLRQAQTQMERAQTLQTALRGAIERRQVLVKEEGRQDEVQRVRHDQQQRQQLQQQQQGGEKELEMAKEALKSAMRTLCKASNLTPLPEAIRTQAHRQQQQQQGNMHRFLLDVMEGPLNSAWQQMKNLGGGEGSMQPLCNSICPHERRAAVLREVQGVIAQVEVATNEVLVPVLGRVEEGLQGGALRERMGRLRTETLMTLRKIWHTMTEKNEIEALVGALTSRGGEERGRGTERSFLSAFAEVAAEAQALHKQWQRGKEQVLAAVALRAEQHIRSEQAREADALASSLSSLSFSSPIHFSASTAEDWATWQAQVRMLEEKWSKIIESPGVSSTASRRLVMFVESCFDRVEEAHVLASALRPSSFSSSTVQHAVAEGVQGVPESWPWLGKEIDVVYILLERVRTAAQAAAAWTDLDEQEMKGRPEGEKKEEEETQQQQRQQRREEIVGNALADSLEQLLGVAVGVPLRLLARSLVDRVIRVMAVSAPDVLNGAISTSGMASWDPETSVAINATVDVEKSPATRWQDWVNAFKAAAAAALATDNNSYSSYRAGTQALSRTLTLTQSLNDFQASMLESAEAVAQAKEVETSLNRSIRRLEWEFDGDFHFFASATSSGGSAGGLSIPPHFYVSSSTPAQSRSFFLQSLSGALVHLSQVLSTQPQRHFQLQNHPQFHQQQHYRKQQQHQLEQFGAGYFPHYSTAPASTDEGSQRVQAWQEKMKEIVCRASDTVATKRRSLSSSSTALSAWESKARAFASLLEKINQGAQAALGAAEGLLDFEESRPDMRWILPQTDAHDIALCRLVSHHQAAFAVVLGKRKALAACLKKVSEAKGQMAALEKEANVLGRKIMEVGQKRRAWMQAEHARQGRIKEGLRYLAAELRDRPSTSFQYGASPSPPSKGSSTMSNMGTRLIDIGMLKAVVRATYFFSSSSAPRVALSALRQVHDDAQSLLQSVHALETEAGAVAVMLESSCGGSTNERSQQQEGYAEEEQRPEAWAAALESMFEGLEGMGGEAHIQALGERFQTCVEELQDLAKDADDAAALLGACGIEGGEGREDQEEEEEEDEEDQVEEENDQRGDDKGRRQEDNVILPSPHSLGCNLAILHPSVAAVKALRKVQDRLEGRGESSNGGVTKALGVNEQVDAWVREATDPDRLCVLFEGWMPFL